MWNILKFPQQPRLDKVSSQWISLFGNCNFHTVRMKCFRGKWPSAFVFQRLIPKKHSCRYIVAQSIALPFVKHWTFDIPLIVGPDAVVSLEAHVRPGERRPGARAHLGDIAGAVTCWSSSFFVPPTAANYASFTYPKLPGSSLSRDARPRVG